MWGVQWQRAVHRLHRRLLRWRSGEPSWRLQHRAVTAQTATCDMYGIHDSIATASEEADSSMWMPVLRDLCFKADVGIEHVPHVLVAPPPVAPFMQSITLLHA